MSRLQSQPDRAISAASTCDTTSSGYNTTSSRTTSSRTTKNCTAKKDLNSTQSSFF